MVIDSDMAVTPAGIAVDVQARFGHSVKGLLTEKVTNCGTDIIALTKQVLKGSRSAEFLGLAARNMVMQEGAILHSEDSLRKMAIITTHLQYQQEAIQKKSIFHIVESFFQQLYPNIHVHLLNSSTALNSLQICVIN
ncbi:BLOC-1-related complex subunit 7 isoform 1-T1 [Liasis olivaceus]